MGSPARLYVVLLAALSMIFVGVLASGATAASTKPYSADITPACVPLSTSGVQFTVTLRNMTKTQMLGSANVFAPAGFVVVNPLEVRAQQRLCLVQLTRNLCLLIAN